MSADAAQSLSPCDALAFGAHPDDVEIACGGAILLLTRAGRTASIVDLTGGEIAAGGEVTGAFVADPEDVVLAELVGQPQSSPERLYSATAEHQTPSVTRMTHP